MSVIPGSDAQANIENQQQEKIETPINSPGVSRRSLLGRAGVLTTAGVAAPLLAGVAHAHEKDQHHERSSGGNDYSDFYRDDQYRCV